MDNTKKQQITETLPLVGEAETVLTMLCTYTQFDSCICGVGHVSYSDSNTQDLAGTFTATSDKGKISILN